MASVLRLLDGDLAITASTTPPDHLR